MDNEEICIGFDYLLQLLNRVDSDLRLDCAKVEWTEHKEEEEEEEEGWNGFIGRKVVLLPSMKEGNSSDYIVYICDH